MRIILTCLIILVTIQGYITYSIIQSMEERTGEGIILNPIQKSGSIQSKTTTITDLTNFENTITDILNSVGDSVVNFTIKSDLTSYLQGRMIGEPNIYGGGSGVIVGSDGYVLTNKHVVDNELAQYEIVLQDGKSYAVTKIWQDPKLDIAIVRVSRGSDGRAPVDLQTAPLTDIANTPNVGQFVIAVGYILGQYENSVTLGIISGLGRKLGISSEDSVYIGLLQTDAAINPGNSGGPLFNTAGEVIGLNTAINNQAQGVGFAIPINRQFVEATLASIAEYDEIRRPYLGIEYIDIDQTIASANRLETFQGARIRDVIPMSAADMAGLEEGDVIVKVNDQDVTPQRPLLYLIYANTPGSNIDLTILRNNERQKLIAEPVYTTN